MGNQVRGWWRLGFPPSFSHHTLATVLCLPAPTPPTHTLAAPLQVLDWFTARNLSAYSISCGQSLLYNNIFPKHKERLGKKMSELVGSVAKVEIPAWRKHFDVVVACEDEEGEDIDVPLISIKFR